MRVAIVHDDLVQWGGAERVLEGIAEVFPDAPIYTSVFDNQDITLGQKFGSRKVITSFLQKIPGWRKMYKVFLPLYPIAFEQFDFSSYDLVISQSTRFSKVVITKPGTKHLCYCHTPPRFLWNFSKQKQNLILQTISDWLRIYDQVSARRVDQFLAGSKNAGERIKKVYKAKSKVLYPFIDLKRFEKIDPFEGGFYLVISRLNDYKRVDLAISACQKLEKTLRIIGVGPALKKLKFLASGNKQIEFLGRVAEKEAAFLLAGARALILPGEEDFGLTPLEAQAVGKPVIAFGSGGVLETVIEGQTGLFFKEQSVDSLAQAIEKFETMRFDPDVCKDHAKKFDKKIFQKKLRQFVESLPF